MDEIENCFLCFTKCDDWIFINNKNRINLNIKEIILKHFWLEVINEFSKAICSICWKNINNFHEFYTRIENVHKSYNQKLKIIKNSSSIDDYETINKATDYFIEKPNISSIKREDVASAMTVREEVYITVTGDIKNEQNDTVSDYDDFNDDVNDDDTTDEDYNDYNDGGEEYPSPSSSAPAQPFQKHKTLDIAIATDTLKTAKKRIRKKKPSKPKPDYTEHNEKLRRYFNMACELCDEQFTEFAEIKKHYLDKHDVEGYIRCCGIKFTVMHKAMQHYEWHENPETFKCESCEKCFNDKYKLKFHIERNHTPASELKYNCDLCDKSFGKKYLFDYHKKASHPREEDKIFNCDACGLKFAVKGFLHSHIKRVHENSCSRVCDICAKTFKCAKGYDYHYLVEHTNTQHKVQCELCGMWVKHKESLKGHMLRLHRAFVRETCHMCSKTCPNKRALASHIRTVHKFVEYPCTICDKLFKKKQTLKEHMTQHTGEKDLYKCLYCPKTFRSSANMYAHRKRAHPKEYEENRLLGNKYPDLQEKNA